MQHQILVISGFLKIVWLSAEEIISEGFRCIPVLPAPLFLFGLFLSELIGIHWGDVNTGRWFQSSVFTEQHQH